MPVQQIGTAVSLGVASTLLCLAGPARAAWIDGPADKIVGGYLEPSGRCEPYAQPIMGWPTGSIKRCSYSVTDTYASSGKQVKNGIVYVADVTYGRLRTWLQTACKTAGVRDVAACVATQGENVKSASGAQFPVLGLVWEDQSCDDPRGANYAKCTKQPPNKRGGDGIYEPYAFHNGVTVRIAMDAFRNGVPNRQPSSAIFVPTEDELQAILTAPVTGMSPKKGYGRILSTTRADYRQLTGRANIPVKSGTGDTAKLWSGTVGDIYRKALSSNDDPLITATVCASYDWPAGCRHR